MDLGTMKNLLRTGTTLAAALMMGCMAPTGGPGVGSESALTAGQPGNPAANGIGKTEVCHIPPGNPANWHTIVVGNPAVQAHLDHGDVIGACSEGGGNITTNNPETSTGTN